MREISRRKFLRRGAAALGAAVTVPYIVCPSAAGKSRSAPSERITMGAIGMGGQGTRDMQNFMTAEDVRMVAVCDADANRLNAAKGIVDEHYGSKDCSAHKDFRELLARDDIDAVVIAAGERWHALLSVFAAKAGKDIYCEKPMSLTFAEGRALADTVKRYGAVGEKARARCVCHTRAATRVCGMKGPRPQVSSACSGQGRG